ncbi:hypothetical protein N8I84_17780 [Streptomyces cynarae]|uniref:Uncharacterized protein n=1 Tax=Streptomyces cynarae TaxID=2981134 RepID=A0ABY6E126_9ACTN|nr:hypothetical protein [Streptomyces cynarae]UXY20360.1 hypothetical protein N8I84_17780 [Streptomyces cynarae]
MTAVDVDQRATAPTAARRVGHRGYVFAKLGAATGLIQGIH